MSMGAALPRIDGPVKVKGTAHYAADFNRPGQAHAVIVGATVGLGRVTAIDAAPVLRLPGVLAVVSHLNAPKLAYQPHKGGIDPGFGERLHVFQDDAVRFHGQPVALVVAETLDQAERAAASLKITYEAKTPLVDQRDPKAEAVVPEVGRRPGRAQADRERGSAEAAFAAAEVKVAGDYDMARENHMPMEPHATVAHWDNGRLTLWSKSQFVANEQAEIAAIFGIARENVRVICPFIGGAFGTSLRTWPHVTIAALGAHATQRPVKLVLNRKQMFYLTGHRPRTVQHFALGATREGKLTAILHDGTGETSRYEQFVEALTSVTPFLYSCANVRTRYRLSPLDTGTPTYMRGPGEASGVFAMECAMDELAYKLNLDPLELRRRNEPKLDEEDGRPFSSRSLMQCYELGAEKFGWSRRNHAPRSMRDGRLLIGWGMASATYPVLQSPANARARALPDGSIEIEAAASDMGPGTYTSMTQVAADTLGLPMEKIRFALGASDFPPTPPHGGSQTMASVGTAVRAACLNLQGELTTRAVAANASPLAGVPAGGLAWAAGRLRRVDGSGPALGYAEAVALAGGTPVQAAGSSARDPGVGERFSMHAFGAVFAEVSVDPTLGMVRVRRMVGAYGAGRIINPRLAASQCTGGMVGGIGMALMERTTLDPRDGRAINAHMADYLMPVNLDTPKMEAYFVEEQDAYVNELGVKGLGEISLVGVAPAIANAIHHATGKRLRNLPIRLEDLLDI